MESGSEQTSVVNMKVSASYFQACASDRHSESPDRTVTIITSGFHQILPCKYRWFALHYYYTTVWHIIIFIVIISSSSTSGMGGIL